MRAVVETIDYRSKNADLNVDGSERRGGKDRGVKLDRDATHPHATSIM